MSDGNIGPRIVLEGEKEYKAAINGINKDMKVLSSELKATSAEFDGNANSIAALTKRSEILKKEYDEQTKKVQTLDRALESAKGTYGESSNQVKEWQIKLNNANAELSGLDKELKANDKYLDEAKYSTTATAKSIDEFGREIKDASDKTSIFGGVLKANLASDLIMDGIRALGGAIKDTIGDSIELASNLTESQNVIDTTFGDSASNIDKWSVSLAESFGISELSAKKFGGTMGAMLTSMGFAEKQTLDMSKSIVELAGDMASFYNLDVEDAFNKIRSGISGETEPLKQLGINLSVANLEAFALAQGIKKSYSTMSQSEQTTLRYQYLMQTTASAQGDFAKTSGSLANQQKILTLQFDNFKTEVGEKVLPAITDGITRINSKFGEMDDELAGFTSGALSVAIDGLGWVMDNAGTIAGGIGGIATGLAVFKAGSSIQAGMDLAVTGWKAYKAATEGATVAQYAMNVAQNLSPVGVLATAVGLLTAGLIIYNTTADNSQSETDLLNTELQEVIDTSKEFNKSMVDSKKSRAEGTEEIKKEYGAIQILSDKLFDLSEKENLSNSEKAKMSSLVSELNKSMPELNLSLNEETGFLNKQRSEVDGLIDANLELYKVKAAQEDLTKIANEQYEAEKTLAENQEARAKAVEQLNQLETKYNGLKVQGTASTRGATQEEKMRSLQMMELDGEMFKLEETIGGLDGQIATTNGTIIALGADWDTTSNYIGDHSDIDATATAVDEFGNVVEETAETIVLSNEEAKAAIDELTKTYETAVSDRTKDIKDAMGLFDEFALNTEISGKTLMDNLKDQVTGMQEWADNLQSLAKKGIDEGLLEELRAMGPEAASEIAALNKLSEPELQAYSEMWKEKSELARTLAVKELETLETETVAQIKAISASAESAMYTSGQNAIDGFTEGFKSKKIYMNDTMGAIFDETIRKSNEKLGIHSPSTVFAKMGLYSAEGYALGITKGNGMIKKSLDDGIGDGFKNTISGLNKEIANSVPNDLKIHGSYNGSSVVSSSSGSSSELNELRSLILELAKRPVALNINSKEFARATTPDISTEMASLNNVGSRKVGRKR